VALALVSGCASMREYRAQAAAADAQEKEIQAARQRDYERQMTEQEAERQATIQREREYDATCIQPPDQAWVNFCAYRERARDRAAQQAQWDRENAVREHQAEIERQELELAEKEHRRQVGRDISDAINAPYRNRTAPVTCSTISAGGISTTHCQ